VDQQEVVDLGELLESSQRSPGRTAVDDNDAMGPRGVRNEELQCLECPAEGLAWYYDHRRAYV
jgi:hypothetical protein